MCPADPDTAPGETASIKPHPPQGEPADFDGHDGVRGAGTGRRGPVRALIFTTCVMAAAIIVRAAVHIDVAPFLTLLPAVVIICAVVGAWWALLGVLVSIIVVSQSFFRIVGGAGAEPFGGQIGLWPEAIWLLVQFVVATILACAPIVLLRRAIEDTVRHRSALQRSEERFRLAAQAISGAIYDWDVKNGYVHRTDGLESLIGLAPSDLGSDPSDWIALIHPDDARRLRVNSGSILDRTDDRFATEYRVRHADGRWIDVWDQGMVLRDEQGRPIRVVGTTVDVTARRKLENELQAALNHQEAMTREMHHRVKNSLQIAASLLAIQSRQVRDDRVVRALTDSRMRIQAVALVHQALYRDGQLTRANVASVIPQICALIEGMVQQDVPRRLHCAVKVDALWLVADHLVPFSLLTTELAVNALRHAYADDAPGEAWLTVEHGAAGPDARDTTRRVRLTIEDRGRGLPAGFDPMTASTLGMQLSVSLTRQLGGTLRAERLPKGSRFVVCLPEPTAAAAEAPDETR